MNIKEVDPYGKGQHDAGAKNDAGKPDASLLLMFGRALNEVAAVGTSILAEGGGQFLTEVNVTPPHSCDICLRRTAKLSMRTSAYYMLLRLLGTRLHD